MYNKKITRKVPYIWKIQNMLINNLWIKEETTMEIRKYFELNDNENIIYQNFGTQPK